jgi:hypothetical protein
MAGESADQGTVLSAIQCFFYPALVPLMRYQAREKRGIDVRFLIMTDRS